MYSKGGTKMTTHSVKISQESWQKLEEIKQQTGIPITKTIDMLVKNYSIKVVEKNKIGG